jgi:hypothetical protein
MFGVNAFDIAVNVQEVFPSICEMTWCHQSQVTEWLPWVGRHSMTAPLDFAEWTRTLRARFDRKNRELGLATPNAMEVFTVTAWGVVPTLEQLEADLPVLCPATSNLKQLGTRLSAWQGLKKWPAKSINSTMNPSTGRLV